MNNQNSKNKLRTVTVNDRGQIVIPEDMRKDLGIEGRTTLVLIEKDGELIVKKEADLFRAMDNDLFWKAVSKESLKHAWPKEDEIWDIIAKKEGLA